MLEWEKCEGLGVSRRRHCRFIAYLLPELLKGAGLGLHCGSCDRNSGPPKSSNWHKTTRRFRRGWTVPMPVQQQFLHQRFPVLWRSLPRSCGGGGKFDAFQVEVAVAVAVAVAVGMPWHRGISPFPPLRPFVLPPPLPLASDSHSNQTHPRCCLQAPAAALSF